MRKFLLLFFFLSIRIIHAQSLPEIEELGLWCVYVETIDGEEPICDVLPPPAGCLGESITNTNKVPCRIYIKSGGGILFDSGEYEERKSGATIRVRGNTSASQVEKKPYKIKLQKKADLLCRGDNKYDDKDWLLIKNWGIFGLIGFSLNEILGLPYAPKFKYVNVILNGNYQGTYLLCESVKRNTDCRIDISKTGYIIEYDPYWWKEDIYIPSGYSVPLHYTFKYPETEDVTSDMIDSFTGYINQVEQSLKTDDYERYIDTDSFILWVIGQDILGNIDAAGSNIFLTKYSADDESKLQMPCLWDFDGIMGSKEQLPNTFAKVHQFFFFKDLFTKSSFIQNYVTKYDEMSAALYSDLIMKINDFVDSDYGQAYKRSFEKDRAMWNFYSRFNLDLSIDEWIEKSRGWILNRKDNLDDAVSQLRIKTDIVISETGKQKRTPYVFNIQGRRLENPKKGFNIVDGKKMILY